MEWIDEQIKMWDKKILENEKIKDTLSTVEYMQPYTEIINLLQLKTEINLQNGKKTD